MEQANDLIELEELRLGNLLLHKGQLVYVSALSYDIDDEYEDSIGVTPFGKTSDEVYKWNRSFGKDLQRIPVTKGIMSALGYTSTGVDFINDSSRWTCGEYWVVLDKKGLQFDAGLKRFKVMLFVNELQNLHYAITGNEMKIPTDQTGEIKKAAEQLPPAGS